MHCPKLCALLIFGVALTVVSLDDSESELDSAHVIAGNRRGGGGFLSTVGTFILSSNRAGNDELEDQDSGELEYDLGSGRRGGGGFLSTNKPIKPPIKAPTKAPTKPQTKPPTEPPTEAPTFDWTQCKSEGGPKNCAKCKGGDLDDNGALPCGSASVKCPDNELWKGSYFFHSLTEVLRRSSYFHLPVLRRGEAASGLCSPLTLPSVMTGVTQSTYDFPGGIYNSSAPSRLGRNLVATKALIAHPDDAHANVGVVMFKRMVMHQCTGTKPEFCKEGDKVADVFKQGYCVKCKSKRYTRADCGHKVHWDQAGRRSIKHTTDNCTVFKSHKASDVTDEQKKAFATQCFTEAFTPEGIMKADYQCSDDDMLYARASIAMF